MDVRKKLVELLERAFESFIDDPFCIPDEREFADHLIGNGVTVQAEAKLYWKPVDERTSNLTCSACDSHLGCREDAKFCPECGAKFVINEALPPKGE